MVLPKCHKMLWRFYKVIDGYEHINPRLSKLSTRKVWARIVHIAGIFNSNYHWLELSVFLPKVVDSLRALRHPLPINSSRHETANSTEHVVKLKLINQYINKYQVWRKNRHPTTKQSESYLFQTITQFTQ